MGSLVPAYGRHPSGRAYVRFGRKFVYLGAYGSRESIERYSRVIAEWQAAGCPRLWPLPPAAAITIADLEALYLAHARSYYRKGGKPTSAVAVIRRALGFVTELYGSLPAVEFSILCLKACRARMIAQQLSRNTINDYVKKIIRAFRWAANEERIATGRWQSIMVIEPLRRGRSDARETAPVRPVDLDVVENTLPFVSERIALAVRLQLYTGMRPGEVISLRASSIDATSKPWRYDVTDHKTAHHGKSRLVLLGARSQALLEPLLAAAAIRVAAGHDDRLFPIRRESYTRAIARACDEAGVPRWSPNRLRHTVATQVRRTIGIEAARALLGHANLKTSEIYAEADETLARRVIDEIG